MTKEEMIIDLITSLLCFLVPFAWMLINEYVIPFCKAHRNIFYTIGLICLMIIDCLVIKTFL